MNKNTIIFSLLMFILFATAGAAILGFAIRFFTDPRGLFDIGRFTISPLFRIIVGILGFFLSLMIYKKQV